MGDKQKGFGLVWIIISLAVLVILGYVGFSVLGGTKTEMSSTDSSGPYSTYDIKSKDADFSVDFYDKAELVKNGDNQQIVITGSDNKKVGVWVKELDQAARCGSDTKFEYASKYEATESCFRSDRLIYASTIKKGSTHYFVSITAQKPVSQSDAIKIFSSVELK